MADSSNSSTATLNSGVAALTPRSSQKRRREPLIRTAKRRKLAACLHFSSSDSEEEQQDTTAPRVPPSVPNFVTEPSPAASSGDGSSGWSEEEMDIRPLGRPTSESEEEEDEETIRKRFTDMIIFRQPASSSEDEESISDLEEEVEVRSIANTTADFKMSEMESNQPELINSQPSLNSGIDNGTQQAAGLKRRPPSMVALPGATQSPASSMAQGSASLKKGSNASIRDYFAVCDRKSAANIQMGNNGTGPFHLMRQNSRDSLPQGGGNMGASSPGAEEEEDGLRLRMAYGMVAARQRQVLGLGFKYTTHLLGAMCPISEDHEKGCLRVARAQKNEDERTRRRVRKQKRDQRHQQRLRNADCFTSSSSEEDSDNDMHVKSVAAEDDFQGRQMVRAATFARVWNCLNDDGLEDDPGEVDKGWLSALQEIHRAVDVAAYAPTSVLHRVMIESMRDHKDAEVRSAAYELLTYCCEIMRPGPGRAALSKYWLQLLSLSQPGMRGWVWNQDDPWNFLFSVLDVAAKLPSDSADMETRLENQTRSGPLLVLQFVVSLLGLDLECWSSYLAAATSSDNHGGQETLSGTAQPLLARVLCHSSPMRWNRRCEQLCSKYVGALQQSHSSPVFISCLRTLVGQLGQLLQLSERQRTDNQGKLELARCLGWTLAAASVEHDRLSAELFLMQPNWLSAAISALQLGRLHNKTYVNGIPNLRELINNYVNVDVQLSPNKATQPSDRTNLYTSASMASSSPSTPRTRERPPLKSPATKNSPKVNVVKRNKYGETALHTACKMGNLPRIVQCLRTPGVDINAADNSGYTPLHEAIAKNREEVVSLLLDHRAQPTMDRYVQRMSGGGGVSSEGRGAQRSAAKSCVDLLAMGGVEAKLSPLQEAVESDKLGIVQMILDKVVTASADAHSDFPTLGDLLESKTSDGRGLVDLCTKNPPMQQLIQGYTARAKPTVPTICVKENNEQLFTLLAENSLVKYMAALCLPQVYRVWKTSRTEPGYSPLQLKKTRDEGKQIPLPQTLKMWQPLSFEKGLQAMEAPQPLRLEFYRSMAARAEDAKDFEKLRFFRRLLPNFGANHPLHTLLSATDQSVVL